MKSTLIKTGFVGLCLGLCIGYVVKNRQYEKKHTFTATAKVENDKLSKRLWIPAYKVLLEDNKILVASKALGFTYEELEDLSMKIKEGTEISYTGWPDKKDSTKIYVRKLSPLPKTN